MKLNISFIACRSIFETLYEVVMVAGRAFLFIFIVASCGDCKADSEILAFPRFP